MTVERAIARQIAERLLAGGSAEERLAALAPPSARFVTYGAVHLRNSFGSSAGADGAAGAVRRIE